MEIETDLDIILIGKTGNGKSATGNSILGRSCFKSSYNTTSVTKFPQYGVTDFEGSKIQVVDCPGVLDTDIDQSGGIDIVKRALQNALLVNPQGYHAFLIVVKFAQRFTKQEQDSIKILKDILGKDVIKNHGIVVLTNGDTFEYYCAEYGLTLERFCKEERGPFKELLNECDNRIVVFNNITKDKNVRNEQLRKLFDKVRQLPKTETQLNRYTNEDFRKADSVYNNMLKQSKKPLIDKQMLISQNLILLDLKNVNNCKTVEEKIEQLSLLYQSSNKLSRHITKMDAKTGALKKLMDNVDYTQKYIERNIKLISNKNVFDRMHSNPIENFHIVADQTFENESKDVDRPADDKHTKKILDTDITTSQQTLSAQSKSRPVSKNKDNDCLSNLDDIEMQFKQLEKEFFEIKREADAGFFNRCIIYIKTFGSTLFENNLNNNNNTKQEMEMSVLDQPNYFH